MTEQEKSKKLAELKACAFEYAQDKIAESSIKKRLSRNNDTIKVLMVQLNETSVELDDGRRVVYSVAESTKTDEEKLIATLKKCVPNTKCIKTKVVEYIDEDILESEIYKDIDRKIFTEQVMEEMGKCSTVTETPKLTIKKAGKKNDDND